MERITYHNAENGFCVLRVKARGQRELVTVVGYAASISAGEFIAASGAWITDSEHGLQFKSARSMRSRTAAHLLCRSAADWRPIRRSESGSGSAHIFEDRFQQIGAGAMPLASFSAIMSEPRPRA
jgi:hypothetical protein